MIDLHSHLLPGIDDGAPDMDGAVAMGRVAVDGGVDTIVGTPHVNGRYPNDPTTFRARVAEVQAALDAAGVALRVRPGAELSHGMVLELDPEALRACTLGDGNFLLLEPPLAGPAPFIGRMVGDLLGKGFQIVLAHPERIAAFQRGVGVVQELVEQGCVTSVTAGSVSGQFGGAVKRFTQDLFAHGLVHNLASDAHDATHRSPALRPQVDKAVAELPELESWVDYLTVEVPQAILAGARPAGNPPVVEPRRGLFGRLRGR